MEPEGFSPPLDLALSYVVIALFFSIWKGDFSDALS
jgi:hypothetical protein